MTAQAVTEVTGAAGAADVADVAGAKNTAPERPVKTRDPFFDNAKFLAILLVVFGHAIEPLRDSRGAHALYLFVYTFHMPVFIIITGYFSRSFTFSTGKARKLITNLAVPYVIFETAYSVFRWAAGGKDFEISLLAPVWLTWFLMAAFFWRLSTPVWQQLRWPVSIAILIALLSGMNDLPSTFEMHRTLGLLPFFVVGLKLQPKHFELLRLPASRVAACVVLAAGLAVAFAVHGHMTIEWAYWRHGNDYLGVSEVTGTAMRLGMLAASLVLSAAFLALVPSRGTWYSALGAATLYAYLLHGFPVKLAEYEHWYRPDWLHGPAGIAAIAALSVPLTIALTRPVVRRGLRWAVEPTLSWAFTPLRRP
ncbi:MAG TPA: acyltransferase family protein [Streptosporangiaceae bacterium]|nr:acyltransferase family protein [Streptosporangiaceae bacterium]